MAFENLISQGLYEVIGRKSRSMDLNSINI
jgi:hypothetical protein